MKGAVIYLLFWRGCLIILWTTDSDGGVVESPLSLFVPFLVHVALNLGMGYSLRGFSIAQGHCPRNQSASLGIQFISGEYRRSIDSMAPLGMTLV